MKIRLTKLTLVLLFGIAALLFGTLAHADVYKPDGKKPVQSQSKVWSGKEAEAKLLELGFSREWIEQKKKEAQERLSEEQRKTTGFGYDVRPINNPPCQSGQAGYSLFTTSPAGWTAWFSSNQYPIGGDTVATGFCGDPNCLYVHAVNGVTGRIYTAHFVVATYVTHLDAWCSWTNPLP